jgi:hypothetical protein
MSSKISLPDGYVLRFHTTDFSTQQQHSIVSILSGVSRAAYIQSIWERQARFIHQTVDFSLDPESLALELWISIEHFDSIIDNTFDVNGILWDFCRTHWTQVYSLFPIDSLRDTDLYQSEEEIIEKYGKKWKIKFWFCGPRVDCGIHNEHDFIEWHIGIMGDGRMEKFIEKNETTLVESWRMSPGQTHPIFANEWETDSLGNPVYPFHRWFGGNRGDIWMVVEEYFQYNFT